MYKHLKSIAVFIAVAETGAFNRAALKLGLKASVVSHHISKLEAHIGATLIYRTTRKLTLSDQGKALYNKVHVLYADTENFIDQLSANSDQPKGTLRISLPQFVPDLRIEKAIWSFCKEYPCIDLALQYTDEQIPLPNDDIDVVIRIGKQADSMLITKQLSSVQHILVASPMLLDDLESITSPDQLITLDKIGLQCANNVLTLKKQDSIQQITFETSQVTVNSINAALSAAICGVGFADLPPSLCNNALQSGALVRLLEQWQLPSLPICATYSGKALPNSLIKLLLTHISDQLSNSGQ